jgi:hypothetical protein
VSENFNAGQHHAYHSDVAFLRAHWGDAYQISYRQGQFRAERRDDHSVVRADSADDLLAAIRHDYLLRPVPRDLPPAPPKDGLDQ